MSPNDIEDTKDKAFLLQFTRLYSMALEGLAEGRSMFSVMEAFKKGWEYNVQLYRELQEVDLDGVWLSKACIPGAQKDLTAKMNAAAPNPVQVAEKQRIYERDHAEENKNWFAKAAEELKSYTASDFQDKLIKSARAVYKRFLTYYHPTDKLGANRSSMVMVGVEEALSALCSTLTGKPAPIMLREILRDDAPTEEAAQQLAENSRQCTAVYLEQQKGLANAKPSFDHKLPGDRGWTPPPPPVEQKPRRSAEECSKRDETIALANKLLYNLASSRDLSFPFNQEKIDTFHENLAVSIGLAFNEKPSVILKELSL